MFTQFAKQGHHLQKTAFMQQYNMRFFSALPRLAKMELTVRTPYRTLFENFSGFKYVNVRTTNGDMTLSNMAMPPRMYLLPAGELKVSQLEKGDGNNTTSDSGLFIHTGGWFFVHE